MPLHVLVMLLLLLLCGPGCARIQVNLFGPPDAPLEEVTLRPGRGKEKLALIPIEGMITLSPGRGLAGGSGGMNGVLARLAEAAEDPHVRGLLLRVDSPGGTVMASELLYREILRFKEKRGLPVVVVFQATAASGAYYLAMAADHIEAHPHTITGSIGVIFMRPDVSGLMEKLGVDVRTHTSGRLKDMGSPFRKSRPEEEALFAELAAKLGREFVALVSQKRRLDAEIREEVATARIFLGEEALAAGLVDGLDGMRGGLAVLARLAGVSENTRVVSWSPAPLNNPHIYAPLVLDPTPPPLGDLGFLKAGSFCYLWTAGAGLP